jgi:aldehyde:ferredoxin oxidoreductase
LGIKLDQDGLKRIAANIRNATQRFNQREGVTRNDDPLPNRFFTEPVSGGKLIKREEFDRMLSDYYQLRGWNERGTPPAKDLWIEQ